MERDVVFPRSLREVRRTVASGRLLLVGLLILVFGGWARLAVGMMATDPGPAEGLVLVFAVELFLAAGILALLLSPRAPTPRRFLLAAALATAALFTADPVALLGGSLALLGCAWGYLASEE